MYNNIIPSNQRNEYIDDPSNYSRNQAKVREGSGNNSNRKFYPPRQ